jgi:hypothetical protein
MKLSSRVHSRGFDPVSEQGEAVQGQANDFKLKERNKTTHNGRQIISPPISLISRVEVESVAK